MERSQPLGPRVTIRDVAQAVGVSLKTVSRVINGEPTVAPATAARVEAVIAQLGFRPDQTARNLRSGHRVQLAGLILSDLANPHVTALASGVEATVRKRGRSLVLSNADEDHQQEWALIADLLLRQVEGLVVVPSGSNHDHLHVAARRIPLVCAHREVPGLDVDTVRPDDRSASRQGVLNLLAAGHERIAFVGDRPFISNIQERLRGFRDAHTEAGVEISEHLIVLGSHTAGAAEDAVGALLDVRDAPTAVYAANNLNTMGTLQAVLRHGREVAVLGFDELPAVEFIGLPVTLLAYDQQELGRVAGEMLIDRIEGVSEGPRTIVVPVEERIHRSGRR